MLATDRFPRASALQRAFAGAIPSLGSGPGGRRRAAGPSTRAAFRAAGRRAPAAPIRLVLLWLLAVAIRLPFLDASSPPTTIERAATLGSISAVSQPLAVTILGWRLQPSPLAEVISDALVWALAAVVGPSAALPGIVAMLLAAATVPLASGLARDLVRPIGRRRLEDEFAGPRLAGLLGALLLATSAAHVVVGGIPGAPAVASLLVVAALFALERALATRDGRWLVAGGSLLGLALQVGPAAWALVPGLAVALWRVGRGVVLSGWGAAGALALLLTYAPLLAALASGDGGQGVVRAPAPPPGGVTPVTPLGAYVQALLAHLDLLRSLLAGQVGDGPPADGLHGVLAWAYVALALLGLVILVLRGRPLLPLAALSGVLLLPLVGLPAGSAAGGPVSARVVLPHLLPVVVPLVVVGVVATGAALGTLAPLVARRGSVARLLVGVLLLALVLAPLPRLYGYHLHGYYPHGYDATHSPDAVGQRAVRAIIERMAAADDGG